MRIFLIAPVNERGVSTTFPIGIACISAALKQAGHEVESINLALHADDIDAVDKAIRRFKPNLVGLGGLTPSFNQLRSVHEAIRIEFPTLPTVLGGGVLTSAVETVFGALRPDFGVIGEGEATMVELVACIGQGGDPALVDGLVYQEADGEIKRTAPRASLTDLNSLPIPDYEGLDLRSLLDAGVFLEILGSRGCPYSCTFCYSPLGRHYRQRSLDHLFREIEHVISRYGVRAMGINDELFAASPTRIREFCERIQPLGVSWMTQLRVDSVDREILLLMRKAGCQVICYGLESMHQDVLRSMNKKITPAQIEKTLELTYQAGMTSFGNFIFGDSAETRETADHTLDWWFANRKYLINLGSLVCWPGSKIYRQALERGVIRNELDFIADSCPETNVTTMADEEYWKMLRRNHLYHNVLLYPARVLDARPEGEDTWLLETVCPHCGKECDHKVSSRSIPFHRSTARLGCTCGRQFDLPVLVPPPQFPAPLLEEVENVSILAHDGDQSALDRLEELANAHKRLAGARFIVSQIHLKAGNQEKAYLFTAKALMADPTIPLFHRQMADILETMGEPKPAAIFRDQGRLLESCQPKGWKFSVEAQ